MGTPEGARRPAWHWAVLGVAIAVIVILVVALILIASGTIAFGGSGARPYYPFWGGFFLVFILIWVCFFVIRITLWGGRRGGYGYYGRQHGMHRDPAVMAARQRYARGEITREQYDQIMTDLGRRGRGPGGPLSGS